MSDRARWEGTVLVELGSFDDWPPDLHPGALLIAGDATGVPVDVLCRIAESSLAGPLRVVTCWGADCERVHDIFDETIVMLQIDGVRVDSDDAFVMTTWHSDESLADAQFMFELEIDLRTAPKPHVVVAVDDGDLADRIRTYVREGHPDDDDAGTAL